MGVAEADLLEEMDLTNVECLNQVRPSFLPDAFRGYPLPSEI